MSDNRDTEILNLIREVASNLAEQNLHSEDINTAIQYALARMVVDLRQKVNEMAWGAL